METERIPRRKRHRRRTYLRSTIASLLIAGTLLTGARVAARTITINRETTPDYTYENVVGYDNIGEYYNFNVHSNNFVILTVSRKQMDITSLRNKIEKCNEKGISIGLVLESNPKNISELYLDFDFIQSILSEYEIDLPIYLNIDNIIENNELNNKEKREIILEFVTRAEACNMYYGFNGKDSNLNNCNKYIYNITNNQVYLVQEKDYIEYEGQHTITKNLDGFIKSEYNLAKPNNESILIPAKYIVKEEDTFENISFRYGISVNDLKKYNNIDKLIPGMTIKIPNYYESIDLYSNRRTYNYAIARGIDISNYQDHIDWDTVKQTSDYCLICIARDQREYTQHKGKFVNECITHIEECTKRNIPTGFYFYIEKDMKISVYEERMEEYLNKIDIELQQKGININKNNIPIFITFQDYYKYNNYYEIMEAVRRVANRHGYLNIGLYCNENMLDQIIDNFKDIQGNEIDINKTGFFIWRAGGKQYNGTEQTSLKLEEIIEPSVDKTKPYRIDIEQATNVCTDTGASNYLGHCNVSYLFNGQVFGNTITSKVYSNRDNTYTLEYDLSNYPNIPIKEILYTILNAITVMYGVLAVTVVGSIIYLKVEKNKEKENANNIAIKK